ncbi:MAG TPA: UDP-4-amino-4,6-dideoxy-N-acetyl-beta-L-altrosamine transaminase [Myxococcota bacterium]|jgi:UDP-4-amino-4,6-dideoxy-N-acetyl-beta-L-altrosamine transaminase|nr:UDP-4-amino-4,6-dideoxy-N-acetyl-beta-L-altrosamine transaminase [Myxococcota bacterium]
MSDPAGKGGGDPPFLPYGRQWIDDDDREAVLAVLGGDWLTQGPAVERFEQALCARSGTRFAVAVSSGTAALHLAALAADVGPGTLLYTTPLTFVASANCARYAGGEVDLADIDDRWGLDPAALAERLARPRRGERPAAVVAVDFTGHPCRMAELARVARRSGLKVIRDACHALGAREQVDGVWHDVGDGTLADLTALSFHPVKHVTTAEGGAVLTNDAVLAERLRDLRTHGIVKDAARLGPDADGPWYYEMQALGMNYRISDLHCALGLSQLRRLGGFLERRRAIAARYDRAFAEVPSVGRPPLAGGVEHAYHLYVVQVPERRRVFERLRASGLGVQVHYVPVHLQPYYRDRYGWRRGEYPRAERYYEGAISLPMFPALSDADVDRVVAEVRDAVSAAGGAPARG